MEKLSKSKAGKHRIEQDRGRTILELEYEESSNSVLLSVSDALNDDEERHWSCIYLTPEELEDLARRARGWTGT